LFTVFLQFAVAHGIIDGQAKLDTRSSTQEARYKKKGTQNLAQK
jgi:hypothetical protein